jgi:tetratricopeptide (TPR) repeat protein
MAATASAQTAQPGVEREAADEPEHQPSAKQFVYARIDQFYNESLEPEERWAAIKELGKFANGWLTDIEVPIDASKADEAEAVSSTVAFLAAHTGPWISEAAVDRFQGRWLDFAAKDHAAGGAFGRAQLWRELYRRLELQARIGHLGEAIELVGRDGVYQIDDAPPSWRVQLRGIRADIYRLLGQFELALADLEPALPSTGLPSTGLPSMGALDWETQLLLAVQRFKLETDLGRLERASNALAEVTRIVNDRADLASPEYRTLVWQLRVHQLLSTGKNVQALRIAADTLDRYEDELTTSAFGLRRRDNLRYFACLAATRAGDAELKPAYQRFASLETVEYLASKSHLDGHTKTQCVLLKARVLHASGDDEQALNLVRSLQDQAVKPKGASAIGKPAPVAPLLASRLASLQYEVALAIGNDEALENASVNLLSAFDGLLATWRNIATQPSGIGFLQYSERRHALHLALECTLRSGENREERALERLLAADACSTVSRRLGAAQVSPARVMELCATLDSTLVYLVPTAKVTHRFIVDASGVAYAQLEGVGEFQGHFGPVLQALRNRPDVETTWPPASLQPDLQWLSQRLVPDGSSSLIYAGIDAFGLAPIQVIPDRDGLPIGLAREVTQAPSVNALVKLEQFALARLPKDLPGLTLFTLTAAGKDRETGDELPAIHFGLEEFNGLAAATEGRASFRSVEEETSSGFVEAFAAGPELFVALTHGSQTHRTTDIPGLYVRGEAGGGRSRTIMPADWLVDQLRRDDGARPAVALLAACSAGAGPSRMGDSGASDFSGALLTTGTPTVITANVRIDERAAIAFVTEFSSALLRQRRTAGAAMLIARRALADQEEFRHPHYWAPLQLFGWSGTRIR